MSALVSLMANSPNFTGSGGDALRSALNGQSPRKKEDPVAAARAEQIRLEKLRTGGSGSFTSDSYAGAGGSRTMSDILSA